MFRVIGKVVSDALQANEDTQPLNVYYRIAPAEADTPYIIIQHVGGGEENTSPVNSFDIEADIYAVSESMREANDLASAISRSLKDVTPTYEGYYANAPIRERELLFDVSDVQGRQFFAIGALYHFRGVKN